MKAFLLSQNIIIWKTIQSTCTSCIYSYPAMNKILMNDLFGFKKKMKDRQNHKRKIKELNNKIYSFKRERIQSSLILCTIIH